MLKSTGHAEKGSHGMEISYPGITSDTGTRQYDNAFIVASLLVLVARGDGHVSQSEIDTMIELVARHFKLTNAQALGHIRTAMQEDACDIELPKILRDRAGRLSTQEKQEILIMLLEVARADGVQDAEETRAINISAHLIDLPASKMLEAYRNYFSGKA